MDKKDLKRFVDNNLEHIIAMTGIKRFGFVETKLSTLSYRGICGCAAAILAYLFMREGIDVAHTSTDFYRFGDAPFTNYDYYDHEFLVHGGIIIDPTYLQMVDFLGRDFEKNFDPAWIVSAENLEEDLRKLFSKVKSLDTSSDFHQIFKDTPDDELVEWYLPIWEYEKTTPAKREMQVNHPPFRPLMERYLKEHGLV